MFGLKLSHVIAGCIAVLVGYTSSIAIIFQAIQALGGTPAQAGSWILMLSLGTGITTIFMALRYRIPAMVAWSTPGAALVAVSHGIDLPHATGAFLFCAGLLALTGMTGWFDRLAALIPDALANAMLAGILFGFALKIFPSLETDPVLGSVMVLAYLLAKPAFPRFSIPLVLFTGLAFCAFTGRFGDANIEISLASPVFVSPEFSLPVILGLGLPLYLVTMSSQNMPGVVVLRGAGYEPPTNMALTMTGVVGFLTAPFGGYAFNLAAITAAIVSGEDADENPATRYKASVVTGGLYCVAGLAGTAVIALFAVLPSEFVMTLAGLALLGTIGTALSEAMAAPDSREAALVTFMATVSGFSLWDIGAPFWALLFGIAVQFVVSGKKKSRKIP